MSRQADPVGERAALLELGGSGAADGRINKAENGQQRRSRR